MMTVARVRARMRRMRDEVEETAEATGELNLVPYLDIVSNIVMFLLATITFTASLGDVNVSTPAYARAGHGAAAVPARPPLNLTIHISKDGFIVATSVTVFPNKRTGKLPTLPLEGTEYPFDELQSLVAQVKRQDPSETKVILNANPEIPYHLIVRTLDAVRNDAEGRELFTDVGFAMGFGEAP